MDVLLVGNPGRGHVGAHLLEAAEDLALKAVLLDTENAYKAPAWLRRANWWLRGRRPTRLRRFSDHVVEECRQWRPRVLVTTGIAPVTREALAEVRRAGMRCANYLTDDPWNPAHRAEWFLRALPEYDAVFTQRRANEGDLEQLGCRAIHYLPFAYNPRLHREPDAGETETGIEDRVVFVGGADEDRLRWIWALIEAGVPIALYGGYWGRDSRTRQFWRGMLPPERFRTVVANAAVNLCLVRRANRDGNAMRSWEVPACGGSLLLEDTPEHRELFGVEGDSALYFSTEGELVDRARWLLGHATERRRLAAAVQQKVVKGGNTYADRLRSMLEVTVGEVLA